MAITKNGIVYPDSYDEVADVPADLKKMAESVDKNIEQIQENIKDKNKEQDAKIENNINSINEIKQENINIKAENQRLRNDIESSQLVEEANGKFIDLSECSNARFNKFEIDGNHKQEVREGYNLFNYKDVQVGKKIDGNTGNIVDDYSFCFAGYISVKENTNYTRSDVGTSTNLMLDENKQRIGTTSGVSFITPNGCAYVAFNIKREKYKDGSYLKFVMNEGTELKQFEEYGASPSPDFPSEIKTVKDNITVKIVNKNIFNKNDVNIMNAYFAGNTLTALDTTRTLYFKIKPNTNYVVSKVKSARFDVATTKNVPVVGLVVENKISKPNDTSISIKSGTYDNYIIVYFNKNDVDTLTEQEILNSIQVEEDTIATTRIEHQEQTITMPVQQEMLKGDYFDFDREKEVQTWGKYIFTGEESIVKSSMSQNNSYWINQETIPELLNAEVSANTSILPQCICTHFKILEPIKITNASNVGISINANNAEKTNVTIRIGFGINSEINTADKCKSLLKSFYEAGNPVIFYYKLSILTQLDFTSEQKAVAKQIKETLHTYKNVTHIYSNDEISPIFDIQYVKDINVENDRLQKQIDEIKQLLSTTQTSAILLDNLQSDVESEVE